MAGVCSSTMPPSNTMAASAPRASAATQRATDALLVSSSPSTSTRTWTGRLALAGQRAGDVQQRQEVALVVGGAAREDAPVAHRGLERRRRPRLERARRLHVVMAVDQDRGGVLAGGSQLAHGERMPVPDALQAGLAAGLHDALHHPCGGPLQVRRIAAAGGDRGDSQPVQEVVQEGTGHGRGEGYTRTSRVRRSLALPPPPPAHVRRRGGPGARGAHAAQRGRAGQGPPRLPVRRLAAGTGKTSMAKILAACLNCARGPDGRAVRRAASRAWPSPTRRRWTSSRWTRRPTTRSTTSATCARASPTRRSAAARRSTSSTRRTCCPRRPGTRSSRRSRSRRRTRSSCWPRPRRRRCCPRWSTAATASTSPARRSSSSPPSCGGSPSRSRSTIGADAVALVARHATGSFRDALGTLEQLVTYSGRQVADDDVLAVLGVADADLLFGARRRRQRPRLRRRPARRRTARRHGPRPHAVRAGPRGSRARAARRPDPGRGARRAARDARPRRAPRRAGRARRRQRRRAAARPAGRRHARGQGRRRRPHAAGARAGEGGRARGRPVGARAHGPHRAPRGRARRSRPGDGSPGTACGPCATPGRRRRAGGRALRPPAPAPEAVAHRSRRPRPPPPPPPRWPSRRRQASSASPASPSCGPRCSTPCAPTTSSSARSCPRRGPSSCAAARSSSRSTRARASSVARPTRGPTARCSRARIRALHGTGARGLLRAARPR